MKQNPLFEIKKDKALREKFIKYEFKQIAPPLPVDFQLGRSSSQIRIPKILQIECGLKHTIMKSSKDEVFGFGDNSHGQIQNDFNNSLFVIAKATPIKTMEKFKEMVKIIHAGDKLSLITYENSRAIIIPS